MHYRYNFYMITTFSSVTINILRNWFLSFVLAKSISKLTCMCGYIYIEQEAKKLEKISKQGEGYKTGGEGGGSE